MDKLSAINLDHFGQILKDFWVEDAIYLFPVGLWLMFIAAFCVIRHFRKRDIPATGYPPGSIPRGAIIFYPPPVGMYYDPEATPMPTHELPPGLKRSLESPPPWSPFDRSDKT